MIKITIECNGETEVVESEYMLLMTGNKDNNKMYTELRVENLTYEETTRTNSFLGYMLIKRLNDHIEEVTNEIYNKN
jgi:23S rRNA maturation mini-RNase III